MTSADAEVSMTASWQVASDRCGPRPRRSTPYAGTMDAVRDAKRALRRRMRAVRADVADPVGAARALWVHVESMPAVVEARVVMAFESVPGEPDTTELIEWCRAAGKRVVVPAADPGAVVPAPPRELDVVIIPVLAFTPRGDRLGQGGGWYDRLLATVRPDCVTIGVGFASQLIDALPTEPHDRRVDLVVTDHGVVRAGRAGEPGRSDD